MHAYMFAVVAVAALGVVVGAARITAWIIDRRAEQATKLIREAAFAAKASADLLPTPSRLRHLEVEASKAGDLLGAARYAELAEAHRG